MGLLAGSGGHIAKPINASHINSRPDLAFLCLPRPPKSYVFSSVVKIREALFDKEITNLERGVFVAFWAAERGHFSGR